MWSINFSILSLRLYSYNKNSTEGYFLKIKHTKARRNLMRDFTNKWGKKIASRPTKGGYSWCIDNGPNAEMGSLFHSWTGTPQNWASLETFPFKPLDILTKLQIYSSRSYFRIFALNIFLSTPTSAASAEWFFNKLKIVKSYLRNTKPGCEFSSQCKLARKKNILMMKAKILLPRKL